MQSSGVAFILREFDLWGKRHRRAMTDTNGDKNLTCEELTAFFENKNRISLAVT